MSRPPRPHHSHHEARDCDPDHADEANRARFRARGIFHAFRSDDAIGRLARGRKTWADLSDPSAVRALPSFDAIVHCAALTPRSRVRDAEAYRRAVSLTTNDVERRYLARRLAETTGRG